MNKPFSQACENNKEPILTILTEAFSNSKHVLEIGTGTGQHAVHLGKHLTHLTWQTSDLMVNHSGINAWLEEAVLPNVKPPIELDLTKAWPILESSAKFDAIYTANTLHIVSWPLVNKFFEGVSKTLTSNATVCIYGPFNYQGKFTSNSNANFDLWLKDRDKSSGIRDIEAILKLADAAGLILKNDHEMPANNRLLVFSKI